MKILHYTLIGVISLLFTACSMTKGLPEADRLD